jgi:hypothetical protein
MAGPERSTRECGEHALPVCDEPGARPRPRDQAERGDGVHGGRNAGAEAGTIGQTLVCDAARLVSSHWLISEGVHRRVCGPSLMPAGNP